MTLLLLCSGLLGAGYVAFNYEIVVYYSTYGYLDTFGIVLPLFWPFRCSKVRGASSAGPLL